MMNSQSLLLPKITPDSQYFNFAINMRVKELIGDDNTSIWTNVMKFSNMSIERCAYIMRDYYLDMNRAINNPNHYIPNVEPTLDFIYGLENIPDGTYYIRFNDMFWYVFIVTDNTISIFSSSYLTKTSFLGAAVLSYMKPVLMIRETEDDKEFYIPTSECNAYYKNKDEWKCTRSAIDTMDTIVHLSDTIDININDYHTWTHLDDCEFTELAQISRNSWLHMRFSDDAFPQNLLFANNGAIYNIGGKKINTDIVHPTNGSSVEVINIRGHMYPVAKLIAMAFIPNLAFRTNVTHINGNSLDNRVENLKWCANPGKWVDHEMETKIRKACTLIIERKNTSREIANMCGMSETAIANILHCRRLGFERERIVNEYKDQFPKSLPRK